MTAEECMRFAAANIDHCYLCGGVHDGLVAFIPTHPEHWPLGARPAGKIGTYWYGLCLACHELPDWNLRAEAKIKSLMN